jgi:hypothetical protein
MTALDDDKDGAITHQEFTRKFGGWFESWSGGRGGALTDEELRAGINRDLAPAPGGFGFPGGPPGGPGAPPGGPPPDGAGSPRRPPPAGGR